MPSFTSQSDWIIMILILLGYELWDANRKLSKIQETLKEILGKLRK
jgi:hypothetical protein